MYLAKTVFERSHRMCISQPCVSSLLEDTLAAISVREAKKALPIIRLEYTFYSPYRPQESIENHQPLKSPQTLDYITPLGFNSAGLLPDISGYQSSHRGGEDIAMLYFFSMPHE